MPTPSRSTDRGESPRGARLDDGGPDDPQ